MILTLTQSHFDMKSKICFKCNIKQTVDNFYKHPEMPDGHVNKCKECNKRDVRQNLSDKKAYYRKYDQNRQRHSIRRILNHRYIAMRQRVEGRSNGHRGALNKELLSWDEFLNWYEATKEHFNKLYESWADNNFPHKLSPSVDRIDNTKGYTADNMQWLTQSENSRKYTK